MFNDKDKEAAHDVVSIDEHNLARECIRLPRHYLQYAHLAAEARRDIDELKSALEVVESDLKQDMRRNPDKYDLEKTTEKGIDSLVSSQPKYKKALARLQDARNDAEMLQAVVAALEHKKRSLSLLVEMEGRAYYAEPKITPEGKKAVIKRAGRRVHLEEHERS